jgi:signal transduction histidine kinase
MKKLFLLPAMLICFSSAIAQQNKVDSLTRAYRKNPQDTTLIHLLEEKSGTVYLTTNTDSGMICARQALALSRKINFKKGEARGLSLVANYLNLAGDLPGSLATTFQALPIAREINDTRGLMSCYNTLGLVYSTLKDHKKALDNYYVSKNIGEKMRVTDLLIVENNNISREYLDLNKPDSALYFTKKAYDLSIKNKMTKNLGYLVRNFGIIQFKKGNYKAAIDFYQKSINMIPAHNNHYLLSEDYRRIAEAWQHEAIADSCIAYGKMALDQAKLDKNPDQVMRATTLLTDEYKLKNDYKEAFNYQLIMLQARDSLFSQQKTLQVQNLTFNEEQRRQEARAAEIAYQNRVRFYLLLGVMGVFALVAAILLFANSQRRKANRVLRERNEQIETQHKALEKTLADLKNTQNQLIQSEKMASLGELTAGIAHEIQNPLNFVNNFSEVNAELIDELELEIDKGNYIGVKTIAKDIRENEQKINMHGKRADFVVKGMLQHSRPNTGEKRITNINVLADEFLKLSYHGLRAKDKNFNAHLVTNFDPDLPKIHVAPQDLGRVMVNFFSNAFFAVAEKKKLLGEGFEPEVIVTTKNLGDKIAFTVRDNGNGVSPKILDKIFQPFFTTKPTGQGTGLGLSLSYDIVKAHGGEIQLETEEGKFTEFIVILPLNG